MPDSGADKDKKSAPRRRRLKQFQPREDSASLRSNRAQ